MFYSLVERRLTNGLRVIVNSDPSTPAVAVNLWYHVGSANEPTGSYGFAHLFEHLMFQGSANVASGEHLAIIQANGGSANATTSFDRTNYFQTVPTHALELALWLEAERMDGLQITQENLDNQREVVKEEKRQRYDNVPYGDALDQLLKLNFPDGHPYQHPAIGSEEDLDAAHLEQVIAFHSQWYRPGNAVLTLSGAVTDEQGFELAEHYFGGIPEGPEPERAVTTRLPHHHGVPRVTVHSDVPQDMLFLSWLTPSLRTPESLAVDQALSILAEGQSSRLHNVLVRNEELADGVGSSELGLSDGTSLALLTLRPRDGVSLERLEERVTELIEELAEQGPTAAELDRALAGYESSWLAELGSLDSRADAINEAATLLNNPNQINEQLGAVQAITAADIAGVFADELNPGYYSAVEYRKAAN